MPNTSLPASTELRSRLLQDVDLLGRRRASAIADDYLDGYLYAGWLEWHGGSLRLTSVGVRVCAEQSTALEQAADDSCVDS